MGNHDINIWPMGHDIHNAVGRHSSITFTGSASTKRTSLSLIATGAICTVIIIVFTVSMFFLSYFTNAFALSTDNIGGLKDDLIEVRGNPTIYASGSTTMNYWVQQVGTACDPERSAVTVSINIPSSSEVTANPSSLTFESCSKPQSVTFGSLKAGTYSIIVNAPNGYKTSSAAFTLYVLTATSASSTTTASGTKAMPKSPTTTNQASSSSSSKPTLYLPANKYVEATSRAGTAVPYTAKALDSLGNSIATVCSAYSGSIFPLGKTTVTCNAKDASGNTQSGSFEIIVQDTTPPDLTIPSTAITAEAVGPAGAAVSFPVLASDIVGGSITPSCTTSSSRTAVSSGSIFPLGKTTVTCNAKDASGNTQSGSFEIIVQDTTPPDLIFAGSNLIAKAESRTTTVSYTGYVSSSDLVDGNTTPTCSPSSGSLLSVGVTTIKCTTTDKHGNAVSESFAVTVRYPTFSGFLPPIRADGSSIFKIGTIIPVKFQLKWSNGDYVSDAAVQIYNAKISNSITGTSIEDSSVSLPISSSLSSSSLSGGTLSTGNYFTYDHSKQEYVYNLQTKDLSVGTWQIKILLDDGSSPSANISIQR